MRFKSILFACAVATSHATAQLPDDQAATVEQDVLGWVQEHQLRIFESTTPGSFLAVNARSGYEAYIDANGFRLENRSEGVCRSMGLEVESWGKSGAMRPWQARQHRLAEHELLFSSEGLHVQYIHSASGLRQNFLVEQRPTGCGPVVLELEVSGDLLPVNDMNGSVEFVSAEGNPIFNYRDLRVWDDCGRRLAARMLADENDHTLRIEVDDEGAHYPLLIDPVASTQNILLVGTLSNGQFGVSVRTAGDLNGDGYSDIVVAAPYGAMGEANEGIVYIYYGSSVGIPPAASLILQCDQANAVFGLAAGTAGDVNGDGYGDLIVGAHSWENDATTGQEGGVFVYHGSAAGISTVPTIILQSNTAAVYMGYSVACAGDINNDGYSDIIAGAPYAAFPTSLEGAAYVFLGGPGGLTNAYHKRLERNQGAAQFGFSVAGIGDVNADGFSDIAISAYRYDQAAVDDGIVCIYHGSAAGLGALANPNPNLTITATGYTSNIGWSIAPAGDVNGDGYSDLVVGDYRATVAALSNAGGMFVYHGSAAGLNPVPAVVYHYPTASTLFGRSVSTAGDVNGDGYADIIVGAATFTAGQSGEGAAFVYLGSATGITLPQFLRYETNIAGNNAGECVSMAGDVNGDGYSDMIMGVKLYMNLGAAGIYHGGTYTLSANISYSRASGLLGARLGASVANAGDVNGDGYSDVVVGAPDGSNGQAGEGLVYVHYGSSTGIGLVPSLTLERNVANAGFGYSVASAGDVNGDGYADVVIGAPLSPPNGQAFIYMGSAAGLAAAPAVTLNGTAGSEFATSVSTAGDVNSDGYAEVVVGAPGIASAYLFVGSPGGLFTPAIMTLTGAAGSRFGQSVATAGDVNGTGYSSVIVGAPLFSNGQVNEGAAFVYHGSTIGIPTTPSTQLERNLANARMGTSVAGAGDVNGDGFYDVIVGAPNWASGQANEGAAFFFYGAPTGVQTAGFATLQSNVVDALLGSSVAEAGDVNGDGYADVMVGAPYLTNGQTEEGRVYLVQGALGGAGVTTVVETNVAGTRMGWAVAGGGDVDGDGYSDVLAGGPNASPTLTDEGSLYMMRGNQGKAFMQLTRQYKANLTSPLSTNSEDFANTQFFGLGHFSKSPIQRTRGRLRWEVVFEGQPFTGNPITNSVASTGTAAAWTDLGLLGIELKQLVAKAPTHLRYKWRLRVEYAQNKLIDGQRFSRWYYGYASGIGDIGILPVELLTFTGAAEPGGNRLKWVTGSEHGSRRFIVERSPDAGHFQAVGELDAAGESQLPIDYEWLDEDAPTGLAYYRLRMVDTSGEEDLSEVVLIVRTANGMVVFPNPASELIGWQASNVPSTWQISDAMGKIVLTGKLAEGQSGGATIAMLSDGTYFLEVRVAGEPLFRSRFVKTDAQAPIAR